MWVLWFDCVELLVWVWVYCFGLLSLGLAYLEFVGWLVLFGLLAFIYFDLLIWLVIWAGGFPFCLFCELGVVGCSAWLV